MSDTTIAAKIADIKTSRDTLRTKFADLGIAGNSAKLSDIAAASSGIINRRNISASVHEGETYTIPQGYHNGSGTVSGISGGNNYTLQQKTVMPSKSRQSVTPDSDYYALSGVTVEPIPDIYKDVSSVTASASDILSDKVIISSNGTPVTGTMKNNGSVTAVMDGLSSVSVTVPAGYTSGGNISLSNDIERMLSEI